MNPIQSHLKVVSYVSCIEQRVVILRNNLNVDLETFLSYLQYWMLLNTNLVEDAQKSVLNMSLSEETEEQCCDMSVTYDRAPSLEDLWEDTYMEVCDDSDEVPMLLSSDSIVFLYEEIVID